MSAFDIIAFPPHRDRNGKLVQFVWSLGPSTRDDTRIRQTTPHIEATLTSNELPRTGNPSKSSKSSGGAGAAIIGLPAKTGEVSSQNFPGGTDTAGAFSSEDR